MASDVSFYQFVTRDDLDILFPWVIFLARTSFGLSGQGGFTNVGRKGSNRKSTPLGSFECLFGFYLFDSLGFFTVVGGMRSNLMLPSKERKNLQEVLGILLQDRRLKRRAPIPLEVVSEKGLFRSLTCHPEVRSEGGGNNR